MSKGPAGPLQRTTPTSSRETDDGRCDFLLEIDGIKGETTDNKHEGTIEIESFSWGASNTGSMSAGGGGGAGKVNFQDLHFTTRVNKASPLLARRARPASTSRRRSCSSARRAATSRTTTR